MYTCAYYLYLSDFETEQTWMDLESITSKYFSKPSNSKLNLMGFFFVQT